MSIVIPQVGLPQTSGVKLARSRIISADCRIEYMPGGYIIDGFATRDTDNPDLPSDNAADRDIRPGVLMGKKTSNGFYANSFIGGTQAATLAGATSFTLTPAAAAEWVRRNGGSTGTLRLLGPPAAAGTVAAQTVTVTAVNTSTGVFTTAAIAAATVIGSLVSVIDGSETPLFPVPEEYGYFIPSTSENIPIERVPMAMNVLDSQLLPWPADASLREWIRLRLKEAGKYVFVEKF